jgi:hypothetical protein
VSKQGNLWALSTIWVCIETMFAYLSHVLRVMADPLVEVLIDELEARFMCRLDNYVLSALYTHLHDVGC